MTADLGSIVELRGRLVELMGQEIRTGRRRDIVVLAVDGLCDRVAREVWPSANIESLNTVAPTTSSAAWLSSLTGKNVDDHGIPGVAFRYPDADGPEIDIFTYAGPLELDGDGLFCDAVTLGYEPRAALGELREVPCSWRDVLVACARTIDATPAIGVGPPWPAADTFRSRLGGQIDLALEHPPGSPPRLAWVYIDLDRVIHRRGYDELVRQYLGAISESAEDLAGSALVIAYSDHGLVPTRHSARMRSVIEGASAQHYARVGGAGRTIWLYSAPNRARALVDELQRRLDESTAVSSATTMFRAGGKALRRVGPVLVVARSEAAITPPEHIYEHGSLLADELEVPLASWG